MIHKLNLTRLWLTNYRRFPEFEIDFDPDLTVIAARNGQGKTTILEAIAAAFGPFVGAFDNGRSKHIEQSDARYNRIGDSYENEQIFPVTIKAELLDPSIQWQRALLTSKSRTTTKEAASLIKWGKDLQEKLRKDASTELPLISYYSSSRLWRNHKNTMRQGVLTESRTMGYEDCLSPSSNYIQLQQWLRKATYAVLQQQQQGKNSAELTNLEARLKCIRDAVNEVMADEEWTNFDYSIALDDLAMSHSDHGLLPLSLLSDGVRAVISLTADMAFRCARLNGQLGDKAAKQTKGIILIDEIDLHLHPAWQQRIITALRRAFPQMQFIVSTHSPQVLSTVESKHIRVVFRETDGEWHAVHPAQEVKGMESAVALNDIMGVDPVPPVEEAGWVSDYIAMIESGSHESPEGKVLRQKLVERYRQQHPVMLNADRLIRFQAFKLSKDRSGG
ncbi:MAG: AAA family ATPase [Sphingomonadaceae bacterium]